MIKIDFCKTSEIIDLMNFLKNEWNENHILSNNINFIKWQHYSVEKDVFNYVIAKKNNSIIGCLGFIRNKFFSTNLRLNDTLWLVNWFVKNPHKSLGLDLLNFLTKKIEYYRIGTVGCKENSFSIFGLLGFETGKLKQYYIINPTIKNFRLVNLKNDHELITNTRKNIAFPKLININNNINFSIFGNFLNEYIKKFGKDKRYFINRYINHPLYNYNLYLIKTLSKKYGLIVTRICEFNNNKSIRIVDFFGNEESLINLHVPLKKLLIDINAEYLDFYEHGISEKIMSKTGLLKNSFDNKDIIPSYYEPFLKKNIELKFAIKSKDSFFPPLFKGDCDQDRPN